MNHFDNLKESVSSRLLSSGFSPHSERDEDCDIQLDYFTRTISDDAPTLVLVSGTHGVEHRIAEIVFGELCLREITLIPANLTVVPFLNEHGAINSTRENRNGIDLNRNCRRSFVSEKAIVRLGKLGVSAAVAISTIKVIISLLGQGYKTTAKKLTRGQNEDRFAPFYFGNGLEDEIKLLTKIFAKLSRNSGAVWYFDFHTGYGDYAKMSLLHLYSEQSEKKRAVASLWSEETVFSEGDIVQLFQDCLADKARLAATIEFGTLPSVYVLVSMLADRARDREEKRDEKWKKRFASIFFPEDIGWAQACEQQALHLISRLSEELSKERKGHIDAIAGV